jgi:hypothetical protein
LGGPGIGYFQDYAAVQSFQNVGTKLNAPNADPAAYPRYESYETVDKPTATDYYKRDSTGHLIPAKKGFLQFTGLFPSVAGLDGARVGTLLGDPGSDNGMGKKLETDIKNFEDKGGKLEDNPALYNLDQWWKVEGEPNSKRDFPAIEEARLDGGKQALAWTAYVPGTMVLCYLLLVLYFRATGGYKAEVLVGHAAVDEKFTGGTEGPGEG